MPDRRPIYLTGSHGALHGEEMLPTAPRASILLAHAGAPQLDGRLATLAEQFHTAGYATLCFELINDVERHLPDLAGNTPLLTQRLVTAVEHLRRDIDTYGLPVGIFASGHATPAALRATALRDADVSSLVCLGGLADLAGLQYLHALAAPFLMLLGEHAGPPLVSARRALEEITAEHELTMIAGANAECSDPAHFEIATTHAQIWFDRHLAIPAS
jgi:putative phosphoribosyl transferase